MRKVTDILCFLLLSVLAVSCRRELDEQGYIGFLDRNEALHRKVNAGGLEYTFSLITPEAMALKDTYDAEQKSLDKSGYRARLKELQSYIFVRIDERVPERNIPVLKYKSSGNAEYEQRVMYYEFYAANDIRLVCDGKEIPPASYQYENRQGLSPHNSLLMAFPAPASGEQWMVVFNDRAMNNLFIKASFNRKDFQGLPPVVIK